MKTKKVIPAVLIMCLALTGCLKDKTLRTYTIYQPVFVLTDHFREQAKLGDPRPRQNQGAFVLYNNTMYVNEKGQGIHVIDYSNPANPVNRGFIPIPGNTGLAIRNNLLYADCYSFLLIFSISGGDILLEKEVAGAFRASGDHLPDDAESVKTVWLKRDTTVTEEQFNNNRLFFENRSANVLASNAQQTPHPGGGNSTSSSLAMFTLVNDYLYTVDDQRLHAFSLSDGLNPVICGDQLVPGGEVETIFPFSGKLFIGSATGMAVYGLADPCRPNYVSRFQHARVCDPVIAEEEYAFVTLRSGGTCGGFVNQLQVLDIKDISNPVLVATYPFSNPHGLSKDGKVLFLCDGQAGLRILDASDVRNITTRETLMEGHAIDVIAWNQMAFVTMTDAIRIYSYDQQFNVLPLGSLPKN